MVEKRLDRLGRHGVDRVAPDQRLHIEHVAIGRVLGAGRRPEQALRPRALGRERLPAVARDQLEIILISELGVGDRDLPAQRGERLGFGISRLQPRVDRLVDPGVDAADEEARHRGDARDVLAFGDAVLEAGDESLGDRLVHVDREQQGDVDVDALGGQRADRRHARPGAGDLDHQIGPVDGGPEPAGLVDRRLGRAGEKGRDFDAGKAVRAVKPVVDRAQGVGGGLDIGDRQMLVDFGDARDRPGEPARR